MRAAVISPFAISSAPIFIFAAISDASWTDAGGGTDAGGAEAADGEMGRGSVTDGMGRCTGWTGVTSWAAPRASGGGGAITADGADGRPESGVEAVRVAADRAGRTLAWSEAGAG